MACIHHGSINLGMHIAKWISFWNLQLQRVLQRRFLKPTWVFEKIMFLGLFFCFPLSLMKFLFGFDFFPLFLFFFLDYWVFSIPLWTTKHQVWVLLPQVLYENLGSNLGCYYNMAVPQLMMQWGSYASWSMFLLNRSLDICVTVLLRFYFLSVFKFDMLSDLKSLQPYDKFICEWTWIISVGKFLVLTRRNS